MKDDTNIKGASNELSVKREMVEEGYIVSEPINQDSRYDLIADTGENLYKIQCKKPRKKNGKLIIRTESKTINTNTVKTKRYNSEEVDYFASYDRECEKLYLIPFKDAAKGKTELRLEEAKINHPSINKAEDYTFTAELV